MVRKDRKGSYMNFTKKEIAEAFSTGNFEITYPYLAENIEWNVVGENIFKDKKAVLQNCEQTAKYFKSVTTNFKTQNVISENNRIAVNGTAEFFRDNKRIAFVQACDVYEFSDKNELQKITSYCINE